jgi:homoserine O-succinyltransferase/O-acetyltransferase
LQSLLRQSKPDVATTPRCGATLSIGLVNNMPGRGRQATERQFRQLFRRIGGGFSVRLRFFALPTRQLRSPVTCDADDYEPLAALWASRLDGLIVTGTEPRAATLSEEPSWPMLTQLVDWAESCTISTIWSCLAAHSATYHLDGIARRTLPAKLSGIFECAACEPHALTEGLPRTWSVPHSRYNDLPEEQLLAGGYRILVRSRQAGADTFIKENAAIKGSAALHVFLQGHPEYDWPALSREYHRDVRRYLIGETEQYPEIPHGYFPEATAEALLAFREEALTRRHSDLLAKFPPAAAMEGDAAPWADVATRFYTNWLSCIAAQKPSRASDARLLAGAIG